ncbi:MAG: CoA-binding protein [Chloracidobacterium sp.]|nr:CoA-binding protein [Chloracidobacterium sp.]
MIGASRDPRAVGGALFRNLIRWGFTGSVYPVNLRASAVAGAHAYASVADLPEVPELVFITAPATWGTVTIFEKSYSKPLVASRCHTR